MKVDFTDFPTFETERLILRRIGEDDMYDIFNMRKEPSLHEYTDTRPDESLDDTIEYIKRMDGGISENRWILWGLEDKSSRKIVGSVSIWNFDIKKNSAELGFGLVSHCRVTDQSPVDGREYRMVVHKRGHPDISLNL